MDVKTRDIAREISTECVESAKYDASLVQVLIWSVKNEKSELKDIIKKVLLDRKAHLVNNYYFSVNSTNFELVTEALDLTENTEFWYAHLESNIKSRNNNEESIRFFMMLMKYPYTTGTLLTIENLCISKFSRDFNETFLRAMMATDALPVRKNRMMLSKEWFHLLRDLIYKGYLKFFRMIIADWINFKYRTNLAILEESSSLVTDVPQLSLLAIAFEANRDSMVWLLAGRTWIFPLFTNAYIRANKYSVWLFKMIPELHEFPWDSPTFQFRQELTKFMEILESSYENSVDAQVTFLTSSCCPADMKQYILNALEGGHVNKIIAAARSNKLLPEHLHLVHIHGKTFKPAYETINAYLGRCDITHLQYRGQGRVSIIVLGKAFIFKRRALKLMDFVISQMGRNLGYMDVLCALDNVYALNELEKNAYAELNETSSVLAQSFLLDPALIKDYQTALDLLLFYSDYGYKEFASELLMRSPVDRQFSFLEHSICFLNLDLILPLRDTIVRQNGLTVEHQKRLYNICSGLLSSDTNHGLARSFISGIFRPLDWALIKESVLQHNLALFSFILHEKTYSPLELVDVVNFVYANGEEDMFEALWPLIRHASNSMANRLIEIFQVSLVSGKTRIVSLLLKNRFEVSSSSLEELVEKRDFAMIEALLRSPCCLDWSAGNNILLNTVVAAGKRELAKILLQYFDVFKGALESENVLAMFPELKQLRGFPLKAAHRQYLNPTIS